MDGVSKNQQYFEVNFDGIVGLTHNYAGLSLGNIASMKNKSLPSYPKAAALQGLEKMKFLQDLGMVQGVLPPQERPYLPVLRKLGFKGSIQNIISQASKTIPDLFFHLCSSSSMWSANAATISPSCDSLDGLVHFTPANLCNKFHRSIEWESTKKILENTFANPKYFSHHDSLPMHPHYGDEGAANHNRLTPSYHQKGIELFVYGKAASTPIELQPKIFPARQSYEASSAIARLHHLDPDYCVFVQQNPISIDAGVFHNDVASVANKNVFFTHELAFVDQRNFLKKLQEKYRLLYPGQQLTLIEVKNEEVSLESSVHSYLFNTQLISPPGDQNSMILVAPKECKQNAQVDFYLKKLLEDKNQPIRKVEYFDLTQSMQNGGGPACLRLRVLLSEREIEHVNQHCLLTNSNYEKLKNWVQTHYRDELYLEDLYDPQLYVEGMEALDQLTKILHLGNIYSFQKTV